MILVKIDECKHFVLYKNEKTGAKEAFLYTDLNNKRPKRIEVKGGNANRNKKLFKVVEIDD